MSIPHFDRPEQDEYLDWLDSLPECRTCEGTGSVHGEFDGEEDDCRACDGSGKVFPEKEEDDREEIQEGDYHYYRPPGATDQ